MMGISIFLRRAVVAAGLSFTLSAVQAAETDGLLLWMVFDDYDAPQVDDCGVYKYIDELVSRSPDGYKVNGARLRVAGTDTYLGISEDGAGAKPYANGLLTIAPDPETGYFTKAGPVWTDLGAYATTEYSFLVELGNWTEDGEWIVMAASAAASYEALRAGGWTTDSAHEYPRQGPWAPTYAVPEPTSGLLMLIGAAFLALRRRRRTRAA